YVALLRLRKAALLRPSVYGPCERGAETSEVGTPLVCINVVDEREGVVVVAVVVLDRPFDLDPFPRCFERDRLRVQRFAVAEQILDEFGEAALEEERLFLVLPLALVLERDRERLVEERQLAQPRGERGVGEPGLAGDGRGGLARDGGAGARRCRGAVDLRFREPG